MSFLSDAREIVEDRLLPDLENRLDQKIGASDKFYVRRKLFREGADEQDYLLRSLANKDTSVTLREEELLKGGDYVVLGRSGAGKSVLALHTAIESYRYFLDEDDFPFPIFLELGKEISQGDSQAIWDALKRASRNLFDRIWEEHESGIYLIVDALDEMLRYEQRMLTPLDVVLMELNQKGSLRLLLTTRRSQWRESDWNSHLLRSAEIYQVDEAGKYEYRQILDGDDDWTAFNRECQSKGLGDLLESPFDGFDLAFRFRNEEALPSNRREHLNQRIDEWLQKEDIGTGASVSTSRLRELAGLLACVMSFGESDSLTKRGVVNALGGSALMNAGKEATDAEVECLLASRLFSTVQLGAEPHYSFDHVLYREALAAEILTDLSLRKQRLLLCVRLDGRERVAAVHRGIARMLAERDEAFRDHLLEVDPPVSLFSSLSSLSEDDREDLLRHVFDWAVEKHITPWRTVEGTGESFRDVLSRHKLSSPSGFLHGYLTSDHEIARLWAAHAASSWGNASGVQEELETIAFDLSERRDTRRMCVRALHRSCGDEMLPTIERLLFDDSDSVRGMALRAYRDLADPSPAEFFLLIQKPKQQPNLTSSLKLEVRSCGRSLSSEEVISVFHHLHVLPNQGFTDFEKEHPPITGLNAELLTGILAGNHEIDPQSAPVVPVLFRALRNGLLDDDIIEFIEPRQHLWRKLFLFAYNRSGDDGFYLASSSGPGKVLSKSASEGALHLLTDHHESPTWQQKSLVQKIRRALSS